MDKSPEQWLAQAEYDMDTAEYMIDEDRTHRMVRMGKEVLAWLKTELAR